MIAVFQSWQSHVWMLNNEIDFLCLQNSRCLINAASLENLPLGREKSCLSSGLHLLQRGWRSDNPLRCQISAPSSARATVSRYLSGNHAPTSSWQLRGAAGAFFLQAESGSKDNGLRCCMRTASVYPLLLSSSQKPRSIRLLDARQATIALSSGRRGCLSFSSDRDGCCCLACRDCLVL